MPPLFSVSGWVRGAALAVGTPQTSCEPEEVARNERDAPPHALEEGGLVAARIAAPAAPLRCPVVVASEIGEASLRADQDAEAEAGSVSDMPPLGGILRPPLGVTCDL